LEILNKMDNIYVIDTKMRGHEHYMSGYLVVGKEVVLIDTGQPNRLEETRASINAHGFSVSDISAIFVTHEHRDHAGNIAPFLRESPKASVYLNPLARDFFLNPEGVNRKAQVSPAILARPGETSTMEAVPESRIRFLQDGDTFDIGHGERLRVMFAPGHQPGGLVIFEEKHNGLFINDLVGNCFLDADCQYVLNPLGSDNLQLVESLKKLVDLPLSYLYLGHYGINDKPRLVMTRALNNLQKILEIGRKYVQEGKPEMIADEVYKTMLPELEKLRKVRGESVYQATAREHIPFQMQLFAKYCQARLKN
jgi:glyoxylase-like metal-dependent hydrolase (beta-lactamase superfamily II)